MDTDASQQIAQRFAALKPFLNERLRRLTAAAEVKALGKRSVTLVARATGVSRRAIALGLRELEQAPASDPASVRQRRPGGGRKPRTATDVSLIGDLERLIEPVTRGDPTSPLRWTCKSLRQLAQALRAQGHQASHRMVGDLLHQMNYSLQANRKTLEGGDHPDRNAQFLHIDEQIRAQMAAGQPVISVDTKKKELVGDFKNAGREWHPQGQPEAVRVHDFVIPELGRANPYGIYDLTHNLGWVSVGTDHDTAAFAVASIRRWWLGMGQPLFPSATRLQIVADGGGSNGSRVRLWKTELQQLADELGLIIAVCHLPPGTSKWNKIEHRLFSHITQNWRGRPLISHEVIVALIAATTTSTGLRVSCELDTQAYPSGIKVSKAELNAIRLVRSTFHGEWNYAIHPRPGQAQ